MTTDFAQVIYPEGFYFSIDQRDLKISVPFLLVETTLCLTSFPDDTRLEDFLRSLVAPDADTDVDGDADTLKDELQ